MRKPVGKIRFTWMLILLLAGVGTVAWGGQVPNQGAQSQAGRSDGTKPIEDMTIEELRNYQRYYYSSGGRDPMTMRLPTSSELGLEKKEKTKTAPTIEQMELFLSKALENITAALKTQSYEVAIKASDDAIYVIDNEWPPLKADPPHLRAMDAEIRNYNRMAVRLKAQEDIKKEFDAMHLRVDGVIWSPADAKAVVNGKLLAAGEVMIAERKQGDLRVEMVEEHGVVFQFKGMRFRLPVELYAPSEATAAVKN